MHYFLCVTVFDEKTSLGNGPVKVRPDGGQLGTHRRRPVTVQEVTHCCAAMHPPSVTSRPCSFCKSYEAENDRRPTFPGVNSIRSRVVAPCRRGISRSGRYLTSQSSSFVSSSINRGFGDWNVTLNISRHCVGVLWVFFNAGWQHHRHSSSRYVRKIIVFSKFIFKN